MLGAQRFLRAEKVLNPDDSKDSGGGGGGGGGYPQERVQTGRISSVRNIDTPEDGEPTALLVAQTFDRIELRGAGGRDGAEDDPHNRRHDDGDDCRQA